MLGGWFDNDHPIQREAKLLVEKLTLIDVGTQTVLNIGFFQILAIHVMDIDFCTLSGLWPRLLGFACKRQIQGSIPTHLGDQVQAILSDHVGAWIIAKMPIHHHLGEQ